MTAWNLRAIRTLALLSTAVLPAAPVLCADCVTWEEIRSSPDARSHHAMAYDSRRGVTVLFGGVRYYSNSAFDDTWEWDGAQWTRADTDGPADLYDVQLAYDQRRGLTILYGQYDDGDVWPSQMWGWDGGSWTMLDDDPPDPGYPYRMVFDYRRGFVVLVSAANWYLQTWEWDGVPKPGPTGRRHVVPRHGGAALVQPNYP